MRRQVQLGIALFTIACGIATTSATAARPSENTAEVSVQEIESAFGWTPEQLQVNEGSLTFTLKGSIFRLVDCSFGILMPDNTTRQVDQHHIFTKTVDTAVDYTITSDGVTLLNVPSPTSLPNPIFACDSFAHGGNPPFITSHEIDDIGGSQQVYATFDGSTELVSEIPF